MEIICEHRKQFPILVQQLPCRKSDGHIYSRLLSILSVGGSGVKQGTDHQSLGCLHHLSIIQFCCVFLCACPCTCPQSCLNETHHGILRLLESFRSRVSFAHNKKFYSSFLGR